MIACFTAPCTSARTISVMLGNGNGTFQPAVRYLVPPPLSSVGGIVIISGDFNIDSRSDIALMVGGASPSLKVSIIRAEYESGQRRLRIEATSTSSSATLTAYATSTGQQIGVLRNEGGGRYRGEFTWPTNPQNITMRSSLGGSATRAVTLK